MQNVLLKILEGLRANICRKPKSEMKPDKIIVGLGNPGANYKDTRHNIGYMVASELASRYMAGKCYKQFHADCLDIRVGSQNVMLLCPTTFMNLSGTSVSEVVRFYKLNPKTDIFVICDDLDLPIAKLRIRESAGSGGQKGLRDIISKLGTQEFSRMRIGIGRPSNPNQVTDFVLTQFRKDEKIEIDIAVKNAADAALLWVEHGCAEVMNKYNTNGKKVKKIE